MKVPNDKKEILERVKVAKNLASDAILAHFLGIKPSTLSNWKARNSIDYDKLFSKCEDLNLDWLLTGYGNMQREKSDLSSIPNQAVINEDTPELYYKNKIYRELYEKLLKKNEQLSYRVGELEERLRNINENGSEV